MEHFDRHADELALRRLDDLALEQVRVEMSADGDSRLDLVIRELVLRAVCTIESVCCTRGGNCGLSREQVMRAIDDASVRLLMRLKRPDRQSAVTAVAAEIAADCVDAQTPQEPIPARLAPSRPQLRVAEQLGEALESGRLRRRDWRSS
ncbi:MAG: hypothetical protein ABW167_01300 [Baekduia sp.]